MKKVLTSSGWVASWTGNNPRTIYLDYEGVEFKRSQSVIRYTKTRLGYDFPEAVPPSVKAKLRALSKSLGAPR